MKRCGSNCKRFPAPAGLAPAGVQDWQLGTPPRMPFEFSAAARPSGPGGGGKLETCGEKTGRSGQSCALLGQAQRGRLQ